MVKKISLKQNTVLVIMLFIWIGFMSIGFVALKPLLKQSDVQHMGVLNDFCAYVENQDIEYINSSKNPFKLETLTVKLYGEEPKTFAPIRHFMRPSYDDKYHVYLRDDNVVVIFFPFDGDLKSLSN